MGGLQEGFRNIADAHKSGKLLKQLATATDFATQSGLSKNQAPDAISPIECKKFIESTAAAIAAAAQRDTENTIVSKELTAANECTSFDVPLSESTPVMDNPTVQTPRSAFRCKSCSDPGPKG